MSSNSLPLRRCLPSVAAALVVMLVSRQCLAVISFELPEVQVTPAISGPTTGTFNVLVHAAPADLPKLISSLNVDFSVANLLVKLGPPSIPTVNPLLSDPGPPDNPFFLNASTSDQNVRWAHDVPADQPLMDGKALVKVPFSVPAGLTGTFPLSFGSALNNTLVDSTGKAVSINLADTGQIKVMAATVGVPGDYNNNGVVDAADYAVWRNNLGTSFALPNEVSGVTPGSVTTEDYNAWRARFGMTSGAGAGAVVATAVPEPASLLSTLLLMLLPLIAIRSSARIHSVVR